MTLIVRSAGPFVRRLASLGGGRRRPTIDEQRARIVYDELLEHRPARAEDVPGLLPLWAPAVVEAAVSDLVAAGLIEESGSGRLTVLGAGEWAPRR